MRPAATAKDVISYQFYNAKSQVICRVDPNGFITETDYYANDLIKRTISYYQKVDNSWFANPTTPPTPIPHSEDSQVDFSYNAKGQVLTRQESNQHLTQHQYDLSGQLTQSRHADQRLATLPPDQRTRPDDVREQRNQFDGWQQLVRQTNPAITTQMLMVEANGQLTPAEKKAAIEDLWSNNSQRDTFDPLSGFHCLSTNSLNQTTRFYYDNDARLTLTLDPLGQVTERLYTTFGEIDSTRAYLTPIPLATLATLTGGLLTDAVRTLLVKSDADPIDQYRYDRRSNLCEHTDPEGYITRLTFNAFQEKTVEQLPVAQTEPTLTLTHTFNPLGQEINTLQQSADLALNTAREFANPHGKLTRIVDAEGGISLYDYDLNGNPLSASHQGVILFHEQTFDQQGRLLTSKNALAGLTTHHYTQATRRHQINTPVAGSFVITTNNIFKETVSQSDAFGNVQTTRHGPSGQITHRIDAAGHAVEDQYNTEGAPTTHISATGVQTVRRYNAAGHLDQIAIDSETTTYGLDSLARQTTITDPRGIITRQEFDKRSLLILSDRDTAGLNPTTPALHLQVRHRYNAKHRLIEEIHGDLNDPDQYHVSYQADALNRPLGKIIDPATSGAEHLQLTTRNTLDKLNRVTKHVDPKGETYRLFYDSVGNNRFKVDAAGGVQEWRYDAMAQVNFHANYAKPVAIQDQTSLEALIALVNANLNVGEDSVTYRFLDGNGNVRFSVKVMSQIKAGDQAPTLKGIIQEYRFDANSREIRHTIYATLIDVTNIQAFTTQSLETLVDTLKNNRVDRTVTKIYNNVGDCCFTINAKQQLHEDRFDAEKRILRAIDYVTPVPEIWLNFSFAQAQENLATIANPSQDQVQAYGFDAFGNPLYSLKANGAVMRFSHDANNNLSQEIHFAAPLSVRPEDDAALKALIIALPVNPEVDRVKTFGFNAADAQIKIIDPLGHEDLFTRDALSNIKSHQNREQQITVFAYDRAKRQVLSTAPTQAVTSIALTPESTLNASQATRTILTKRQYDNNNNLVQLISDYQGNQARTVTTQYAPLNRVSAIQVADAAIDDASKPTRINPLVWPTKQQDLSKQTLYNAKGLLIVLIDEALHYRFKVYDSLQRLRFSVCEEKAGPSADIRQCSVKGYEYNTFGDKVWETHYATFISVNVEQAKTTGLTLTQVAQTLASTARDQVTWYDYNQHGEWTQRITGIVRNPDDSQTPNTFYFNPVTQDIGTHYRVIKRQLNLLGYPELIAKLISPQPEVWQYQRLMYDLNNEVMLDAVTQRETLAAPLTFHVRLTLRNSYEEVIASSDFYQACSLNLADLRVSPADVLAFYQQHPQPGFDKIKLYTYNLQGKKQTRTLKDIPWASLQLTDPKNPSQQAQLTDAIERYTYNRLDKLATRQFANQALEYYFYNPAGALIAHAAIPRQLTSTTSVTPLKMIGIDAHGQAITDSRYVNGALMTGGIPEPTPASISPEDQTDLKLLDPLRGLPIATQNARGIVKAATFTPTRKTARLWQAFETRIVPQTILAETSYLWDVRGRMITKRLSENQQLLQATYKQLGPFGEDWLEGPDNIAWPLYRDHDNTGHTWRTNENKVPTILLRDLTGRQTAEIVAQTSLLKTWTFTDVKAAIDNAAINYLDIEINQSLLDEKGRLLQTLLPRSVQSLSPNIKNIPLQVLATPKSLNQPATLSWVVPQASNVEMTFNIWQDPAHCYTLPINTSNGRCLVDVGTLATDLYDYRIDYSLKSPSGDNPNPALLYQTHGSVGIISSVQNGHRLVASVRNDHILCLAGVDHLTQVTLQPGGTFSLTLEPSTQHYWVDLNTLPTGSYTAFALNQSGLRFDVSVPFVINTALAPSVPIAREIPAISELLTLNQYGQLMLWESLPLDYQQTIALVKVRYTDQNDQPQEESFAVDPAAPTTPRQDSAGHTIQANITFSASVKEILKLDIALSVNGERILLYLQAVPTGSQQPSVTHELYGRQGRVESRTVLTHVGREHARIEADGWDTTHPDEHDESWHTLEHDELNPRLTGSTAAQTAHDELTDVGHNLDPSLVITWSCPPVKIAWLRGLAQTFVAPPTLTYCDVSADNLATWKEITALAVTHQALILDVTGHPAGNYPYIFAGGDKAHALLLTLADGASVYASVSNTSPVPTPDLRHIDYTRDVRGNPIKEIQADGGQYDRRYTLDNRLLSETGPVISVQAADGTINKAYRPITQQLYDLQGTLFGSQLPRGNLDAYVLNKAGDRLTHILGDGTLEARYGLDGFGRTISRTLANNAVFLSDYNQTNQVIRYTIPNDDATRDSGKPLIHQFSYNAFDSQDQHTDAANNVWLSDFDSRNNVIRTETPANVLTQMTYGRGSYLLNLQTPMLTLSWTLDPNLSYFGVVATHLDGGGSTITYGYNQKGEITSKQGQSGAHGNMTQIREVTVLQPVPKKPHHKPAKVLCDMFIPYDAPTPPANTTFNYVAGRLMSLSDQVLQLQTEYSYDARNRPTSVLLRYFDKTQLHSASAIYNALGDEVQIYNDSLLNAEITYDENRNVRRKLFDVTDTGRGLKSTVDHGFTYDRADRALIIDGAFTPQGVALQANSGFEATYLNNQRVSEGRLLTHGTRQDIDYTYWQSGEMRTGQIRNQANITQYFYHPSGYQRLRQDSHTKSEITTNAALFQTNETDYAFKSGRFVEQASTTLTPALDGRSVDTQSTSDHSHAPISYGYQYHYLNFDTSQTSGISGWTKDRYGRQTVSSSVTYDPQGFPNGKWGVADDRPTGRSLSATLIWYVNGQDGLVYQKWYLYSGSQYKHLATGQLFGVKNAYFYSPRGAYLGSYQNELTSEFGTGSVKANNQYHLSTSSGNTAKFYGKKPLPEIDQNLAHLPTGDSNPRDYDRDLTFLRIDRLKGTLSMAETLGAANNFSPVPQVVLVKAGDTYDSLAQSIYGTMADASALMAEASGDTAGSTPQAGSYVVTPQMVISRQLSTDSVPLSQALQAIIGTLLPTLTFAQPQRPNHWLELDIRITIDVLAVVIAMASGGMLTGLSYALVVAAAAATADLAMQEIAVHVGLLQSMSWQEVLMTGVSAGMTAGFGGGVGIDGQGGTASNFFPSYFKQFYYGRLMQVMTFAASEYVVDQLVLIAAGKSQGFNMKALVEAMIEAGIAYNVGSQLDNNQAPLLSGMQAEITTDFINAFVGSAIMGGPPNLEGAMTQAIGASIGNSIASTLPSHDEPTSNTPTSAPPALANVGPTPNPAYYRAAAAAKGVSTNATLVPASDLAMTKLIFGGLNADAHDFAMSVMSNSNIPVTSVNQQSVRPAATSGGTPINIFRMKQLLTGADILNPAGTIPVNAAPAQQVASAQSSIGGLHGVLNKLGERFENLMVYGKFNTNQEEANYISNLAKAYKSGNGQFAKMLRNNSPVSGTINVLEGLASSGVGLMGKRIIEIPGGTETTLYHSVTSARNGQGVLNGINPEFLKPDNRFGKALYLAENPNTTLAELTNHNSIGVNTIRYVFNSEAARVLDLTKQPLAKILGYSKGAPYEIAQPLAQRAQQSGFNVIRYPSARALGANIAVLNNFDRILTPQMIVPVPKELTPEPFTLDLNGNKFR